MENKKVKIVSIISIIALVITIIGATYAYFVAQTGEGKSTDIKINANTVDTFTFEAGSALNLNLNQDNFASGAGNQTGTTYAKAMLTANNKTNTATEHYYLYLNISSNTFTYTQDENTPEILLTIKDGSNNEITSINGLTHKTVTDGKGTSVSGFDITTKSGLITLFDNREITTTSSKTEQWNITVTFINYNADQSKNASHSIIGKVLIQKEEYELTLADICSGKTLSDCVISQYTGTQGNNGLYYHNSTLTNGAGDNSYRYAGANPNNYVCFGSDATCTDANLFRIIGVFGDKTKVIRAKSVGDQKWNKSSSNTWSSSSLNTYLNGEYLTSLGTLANKISTITWKTGGGSTTYLFDVPKTAYQYEVGSGASSTTYDAQIGLMYVSDYGFAADTSAWTTKLVSYNNNSSKNWLYLGSYEWTISRHSNDANHALGVASTGSVNNLIVYNYGYAVRPTFFLEPTITYVSGTGTQSDPIIIN